jgi:ribonuclease HI
MSEDRLQIFTDGACEPNPGPGGYGVVIISGEVEKVFAQGYTLTTNNRMELMAVVAALEAVEGHRAITLYSDSKYVVEALNVGSARSWRDAEWVRKGSRHVPNSDLWQRLLELDDGLNVTYKWVKGHSGNRLNEMADSLSYEAIKNTDQLEDLGYLRQLEEYRKNPPEITEEGQPCRKCSTPVIKRKPKRRRSTGKTYYFEYYLYCPGCETIYMVEDAKRHFEQDSLF